MISLKSYFHYIYLDFRKNSRLNTRPNKKQFKALSPMMVNTQFVMISILSQLTFFCLVFFKASALWADAFYKLKCLSVCVSVRLFTLEVPFKRLFVPTSQSRMSNIFRDLESLGKSNGNKWLV